MKSNEIRRTFLDFFAKRNHEVVPSAPLVPRNDPTLMFVNAGMVPFKDVFTGKEQRATKRACSSQKCIRISGKHNDLENVGVTARHHTFFEMLGNFSFGDYFKEEAIVNAWDLLTKVFGVDQERLVITVFKGAEGFEADDEAAALWKKVSGLGDNRIIRLGMADNFWTMGDTGPCGPCSEIHYYHGDKPDVSTFGQEPGGDGIGWTEIWNLVFMQYNRATAGGEPVALPAPSIDTGAGLERLAGVLQGVTSNYDTDLLAALTSCTADIAKKKYTASDSKDDVSMRVVADHARTAAFLIAEGVMPDKQRREYVLRRVMRRAIRHGHRLGINKPFLHKVAARVVATMGDDYPELRERSDMIAQVVEGEEVRFRATLKRGMKILDDRIAALDGRSATLEAETVADLYTTYGFPLDLTEVIARERDVAVDLVAAQALVKGASGDGPIDPTAALDPAYRAMGKQTKATTFLGYDAEQASSKIAALIRLSGKGNSVKRELVDLIEGPCELEFVVEATPFYAESGGQVADAGTARVGDVTLEVRDVQKPVDGRFVHRGRIGRGKVAVGDAVELCVDTERRSGTRRNHSATHLLHWALKQVLGEHAQQKGSRVAGDELRFDFAHNHPLSTEQIAQVEDLVNQKILTNAPVETAVLPIAEARAKGAVAIFEEKYGDEVRVLTMTADSVELCGGTHCRALGELGLFKILSEGGTAAGVRRIQAATGHNAARYVRGLEDELRRARVSAKAHGVDLAVRIDKMLQHDKTQAKRIKELEKQLLEGGGGGQGVDAMLEQAEAIDSLQVLAVRVADGTAMGNLRELAEKLRDRLGPEAVVLVAAANGDKAQLALMVSKAATKRLKAGDLIKPVAALVGGKGGGRPDMAQAGGSDPGGLDRAVAALADAVRTALKVT